MPRWLSGLGYVLGLLYRWFDSWRCSYFFIFFATQLLIYYDIADYSVFFAVARLYYDIVFVNAQLQCPHV